MKEKRDILHVRRAFRRSLKEEKKLFRQAKKNLKAERKANTSQDYQAWKIQFQDDLAELKSQSQERKKVSEESYKEVIQRMPPYHLKRKELKKYRLPQVRERYKIAKRNLSEARETAQTDMKASMVNPKFQYGQSKSQKSNFLFQGKTLEELQAKKEVKSAKADLKTSKRAYKTKKKSTKAKKFLYRVGQEGIELASTDDDLEGARSIKDQLIKGRRVGRATLDVGKVTVKTTRVGVCFGKKRVQNTKKRYRNLKSGKGFKLSPNNPIRFQNHFSRWKKRRVVRVKSLYTKFKSLFTFFSVVASSPITLMVSGILIFLFLMMSFFIGLTSSSLMQQDEFELTKAYTHMTWEDAEHTRTSETGITYYTKMDEVMGYMNYKFHDYELDKPVHLLSSETYKDYLSSLWQDLNGGEGIHSMKDLYDTPKYKLSADEKEELKELKEDGVYASMQELDNPFEGQTNEDTLTMSYRFGYYALDGKPTFQNYIILEAKPHQTIVAPMDGVVSLDGDNVILTNGKGENESKLTLFNISNGRAIEGTRVLAGDSIGEIKDETGLKITYQKYKDKKDKLTYVNPQFYFPEVIQLQTTILPTIGQFGGDEFAKAKAIYDYLKAKGASPQSIAAILGNWSVESSINPKRAEGDYLSPPVGASEGSWDDENWLAVGGPAIYGGGYSNILHRGLGLGQWTDTADGSVRHTALLNYARSHNKKWYDLDLQLDFMLNGDSPYYTNWLNDFFGNTGSPASLAQLFLTYWEGNSGDKLLERQTRATEWYYQIEKGFSQPHGGTAQSDSKALESVRGELYDNSVPGGGDGMGYAYGQCTWGVAARINQLGLKLKGRNGEKISIINTMGNGQDWVTTAASLGGETGSTPRAGAIISFVGGSHGTLVSYGHVSFVEKVYPDGSFLVSETNVNGNPNYTFRRFSQADSAMSFAYTTK